MSWATMDDVVAITGRESTVENLTLAHTMVEIIGGASPTASDDDLIASSNLRRLQQATAFQAVWLDDHPDVLTSMDVEGISQDGLNAQYASRYAHLMAPMATLCINRLSWKKGPIRIGRNRRWVIDRGNRDSAVRDDQYEWTPMPFGSTPR